MVFLARASPLPRPLRYRASPPRAWRGADYALTVEGSRRRNHLGTQALTLSARGGSIRALPRVSGRGRGGVGGGA